MEECLNNLSRNAECPTDEFFALHIRLRLLALEMEKARCSSIPPHFYVKAMQSKLDNTKAGIAPHLQNDGQFGPLRSPIQTENLTPSYNRIVVYFGILCRAKHI
jgi:hypothetical protein